MKKKRLALPTLFGPPVAAKVRGSGWRIYDEPILALCDPGFPPFTRLHLAIWQLRARDLQDVYPLDTREGRLDFLAWCTVHGRREYRALVELPSFQQGLNAPAHLHPTPWSGAISCLMQLVVRARDDLGIDRRLASAKAQSSLLGWYWLAGGYRELNVDPARLPAWQKQALLAPQEHGFSLFAKLIYAHRPDLRTAFDLGTQEGRDGFRHWLQRHAPEETPLGILQETVSANPVHIVEPPPFPSPWGVNLIGYAFGELGIGEDVRMAARALHSAKVPFTVIDFPPGRDIRQRDRSIAAWVTSQPRYAIDVICLTALEHLRLFAEWGPSFFAQRYIIGYWPWELAKWPTNWEHCFNLVDEVWVSSEHTRRAAEEVSPVPVRVMPMAVVLPEVSPVRRQDYDLPQDHFLFVFSFDGKSGLARKNPLAVLNAFQHAFPRGDEPVGLVIKCMRPDARHRAWQRIRRAARHDARIRIINRMLAKPEVLGLYQSCDCFVSLHRAEGFGRGIAEALLLGLAVIATDHGGNVDFCRAKGVSLVPWTPVPVGEDEYVESTGQFWAEPDVNAAARLMRAVSRRPKRQGGFSRYSQGKSPFDPGRIGANYRARLEEVHRNVTGTS